MEISRDLISNSIIVFNVVVMVATYIKCYLKFIILHFSIYVQIDEFVH